MMKIPVENLGLFEQLDRIVVAFFSKQQPSSPYDLNSCPTTIRNGFR